MHFVTIFTAFSSSVDKIDLSSDNNKRKSVSNVFLACLFIGLINEGCVDTISGRSFCAKAARKLDTFFGLRKKEINDENHPYHRGELECEQINSVLLRSTQITTFRSFFSTPLTLTRSMLTRFFCVLFLFFPSEFVHPKINLGQKNVDLNMHPTLSKALIDKANDAKSRTNCSSTFIPWKNMSTCEIKARQGA